MVVFCFLASPVALVLGACSRQLVKMSNVTKGMLHSYCKVTFGSRLGKFGTWYVLLGGGVKDLL